MHIVMERQMLVQRVFWPEGLSSTLANGHNCHILYGWQLPAPSATSIGRSSTASYLVVGSLDLGTTTTAISESLNQVRQQLRECSIEHGVIILGSWAPAANLTVDIPRLRQDRVLLDEQMLRTYGCADAATSLGSAAGAVVPSLHKDASCPYHSHQVSHIMEASFTFMQ
jgi:hypothetical protein